MPTLFSLIISSPVRGVFVLLAFLLHTPLWGQNVVKKNPNDEHGVSYDAVFENMHYNQPLRPQIHYTPITGQIADPTGLIKYKGKFHLFYMFDEWSRQRRDNKNWGYATSNDGVFWEQHPPITNTVLDNRPGSGSGIVDWNNSLGLQTGPEKTLVVFYTDYGRGPSLAFSRDEGKTWVRHKKNPVLPGRDGVRDPYVFWYKPDQSWRMVLYDSPGFAFYKSTNLTDWQFLSKNEGFYECPDMLQMPVDGNEANKKWVLTEANGSYYVGEFDGTHFRAEGGKKTPGEEFPIQIKVEANRPYTRGKDLYAVQTWKETYEGDGPFYQIGFLMGPANHTRTWSQQLSFPVELTLQTIKGELRLCRTPINALKQLRTDAHFWKKIAVSTADDNPFKSIEGDVFEVIAELDVRNVNELVFDIRGEPLRYSKGELQFMGSKTQVLTENNKLKLHVLIDRSSVEIYVNRGEVAFTRLFYPDPANKSLSLTATGGKVLIDSMELYRLESIWLKREQELGYKRELTPDMINRR